MTKFWSKTIDILDDALAYILTIVGILFSSYIPYLKSKGTIDINIDIWRILLSAVVALMIIGKQEVLAKDNEGNTEKARAGRRKRFSQRMFNAVSQGVAWNQFVDMVK